MLERIGLIGTGYVFLSCQIFQLNRSSDFSELSNIVLEWVFVGGLVISIVVITVLFIRIIAKNAVTSLKPGNPV